MDPRDIVAEITVRGERFEFSSAAELLIDRDDLDTELARQAAKYAWFYLLRERARHEKAELEALYEDTSYEVDQEVRKSLEKKVTETEIKAIVRSNGKLKQIAKKLRDLEANDRQIYAFVQALEQRKDLLVSLARSRNLEMSTPSADEVERMKKNILGG